MAKSSSKADRLKETVWAILILVCMGLVVLHLVHAVRSQSDRDESLVERTFTSASRPQ